MKYTVAHIDFSGCSEVERDIQIQALADLGFEAFDGDDAYIQSELWEELEKVQEFERFKEFEEKYGIRIVGVEECPDENWNATWEEEHPMIELAEGVRIMPHCAFGAGYHETTSMMIDALLHHEPAETVLDMGCGTGVLAIYAARRGAKNVLAVDIDDKSTDNALENAALNEVHIDVLTQGVVPTVPTAEVPYAGRYDLILANIHRNILLSQMADYAATLNPGGELWMSGFYESDIPTLVDAAKAHGLTHLATHANGDWRMVQMKK